MQDVIYVELLDEGVDVWRPVEAEPLDDGWYRITGERNDDTELWTFDTGDIVRCEEQHLSGVPTLVAIEKRPAELP